MKIKFLSEECTCPRDKSYQRDTSFFFISEISQYCSHQKTLIILSIYFDVRFVLTI